MYILPNPTSTSRSDTHSSRFEYRARRRKCLLDALVHREATASTGIRGQTYSRDQARSNREHHPLVDLQGTVLMGMASITCVVRRSMVASSRSKRRRSQIVAERCGRGLPGVLVGSTPAYMPLQVIGGLVLCGGGQRAEVSSLPITRLLRQRVSISSTTSVSTAPLLASRKAEVKSFSGRFTVPCLAKPSSG